METTSRHHKYPQPSSTLSCLQYSQLTHAALHDRVFLLTGPRAKQNLDTLPNGKHPSKAPEASQPSNLLFVARHRDLAASRSHRSRSEQRLLRPTSIYTISFHRLANHRPSHNFSPHTLTTTPPAPYPSLSKPPPRSPLPQPPYPLPQQSPGNPPGKPSLPALRAFTPPLPAVDDPRAAGGADFGEGAGGGDGVSRVGGLVAQGVWGGVVVCWEEVKGGAEGVGWGRGEGGRRGDEGGEGDVEESEGG